MIFAFLKKDAHPNITDSAALCWGGRQRPNYRETIPMKLRWRGNKVSDSNFAGKCSTKGGNR